MGYYWVPIKCSIDAGNTEMRKYRLSYKSANLVHINVDAIIIFSMTPYTNNSII